MPLISFTYSLYPILDQNSLISTCISYPTLHFIKKNLTLHCVKKPDPSQRIGSDNGFRVPL